MKKRILIVEDEDKLRRILELHLLDSGFEGGEGRSSVEEALPLIAIARTLILTDLKLPGMTGLEMLATRPAPGFARPAHCDDGVRDD